VGGGSGGVEEVVTGIEVVAIAVEVEGAAPSQPGVVPHAVPSKQLEHPGYECAGLQSKVNVVPASVSVNCAQLRGRIASRNTAKSIREAITSCDILRGDGVKEILQLSYTPVMRFQGGRGSMAQLMHCRSMETLAIGPVDRGCSARDGIRSHIVNPCSTFPDREMGVVQ